MAMTAGGLVAVFAAMPISQLHAQAKPRADRDTVSDSKFIHEVAADNMVIVLMGQQAERKAQNSSVKQFGQREVTDHNRIQDELKSVATKSGVDFRPGLGERHRAKLQRVEKESGKAFDRTYIRTMVDQYQATVSYFQNEGRSVHSGALRDYVSKTLPLWENRLRDAKQIAVQVGADSTAAHAHHVTMKNKPARKKK
jgi:putative membrane protein